MAIRLLPQGVQSILRSGIILTSPAQAVVELVLNSLDAGATSIAVRVDLKLFKLQVIDNGCGIELEQLDAIGPRYMTSKCHTLEDLQSNLTYYGFRGEALSSLREVSGLLVIVTRPQRNNETYCKSFIHGQDQSAAVSDTKRPACGTTITVQDFMYNMPVRRKRICAAIDLEEIRSHIMSIALMHPQVSFSLRDNAKGSVIFEKHKSTDFITCFSHIFGQPMAESLAPIHFKSDKFIIKGFISKEPHRLKYIQYIYVNKRLIVKTKLHRLVNALLSKSSILRANGPWRHRPIPKGVSADRWLAFPSPDKKNKYPVFVIQIECASKEYDVCLDPKKTLVEFEDWKSLSESIEEAIRIFLEREQLVNEEGTISSSQKSDNEKINNLGSKNLAETDELLRNEKTAQHTSNAKTSPKNDSVLRGDKIVNLPKVIQGVTVKRRNITSSEIPVCSEISNRSIIDASKAESDRITLFNNGAQNKYSDKSKSNIPSKDDTTDRIGQPKSSEFCVMDRNQSINTESDTPPIVKFKRKYQPPSVSNLKITKGAYLFKLEESKKKNISKILEKYDISVANSKVKKAGQSQKNHDVEPINSSDCVTPDKKSKEEIRKCLEEVSVMQNNGGSRHELHDTSLDMVLPTDIILPSDLSLCERTDKNLIDELESLSERPRGQNPNGNIPSSHVKIDKNNSSNINVVSSNFSTCSSSTEEIGVINVIENKSDVLSPLRPSNHGPDQGVLSDDTIESLKISPESTSSLSLSPNQKNFLTTEDFLHSVGSENNSKKKLSSNYHANRSLMISKELPLLQIPVCGALQSVEGAFMTQFHEKQKTRCVSTHACDVSPVSQIVTSPEVVTSPEIVTLPDMVKVLKSPEPAWNLNISPYFNNLFKPHVNNTKSVCDRSEKNDLDITLVEKSSSPMYGLNCDSINECEPYLYGNSHSVTSVGKLASDCSSVIKGRILPLQTNDTHVKSSTSETNISYISKPAIVDYPVSEGSLSPCESLDDYNSNNTIYEFMESPALEIEKEPNSKSTGDSFHPRKGKKVTFSETVKYSTPSVEDSLSLGSQETTNQWTYSSSISSDNSERNNSNILNLRYNLENMNCQTSIKSLSISKMEFISISPSSSPYFHEKTSCQEPEMQTAGDASEKMDVYVNKAELKPNSSICNVEVSSCSSEYSMSDIIPLTQRTPVELDLHNYEYPESQSLAENRVCLINVNKGVTDQADKLHESTCTYESPYFSHVSKDSTRDVSQLGMETVTFTRKRYGDDLRTSHGKKTILDVNSCYESCKNQSENDNIVEVLSSQDLLRAYDNAISNITTSQRIHSSDCNMQGSSIQASKINQQSGSTEILNKNEEWLQMTNSEGNIFYMHKRSGITSFNGPAVNEPLSFTMTKRYEFLPKGMSPLLGDEVPSAVRGNAAMSPNSREELHSILLNDNSTVDNDLAWIKWKGLPDLESLGCKGLIKNLLSNAENRMQYCEAQVPSCSKLIVKMSNSIYNYNFDKEIFSNLKVIGQLDNKFIMTIVSLEKTRTPHVIGVFDQHAVHERIRLEKLMTDYLEEGTDSQFRNSVIDPPVNLDLSGKEYRIMSSYREKFEHIGLQFTLLDEFRIKVLKVPTCLHNREARERSKGVLLKNFLELLIQEYVEFLLKTRGNEPWVPDILREVINYEACRGAIKFGDPLTKEECWVLLANLSKCRLPFYCAHGRPSFVPIFDMKEFREKKQNDQGIPFKKLQT